MEQHAIGTFISRLRKEQHMTQKELAAKLNVTDKAVSKWERGLCCPDIALLTPLAEALNVSVGELLRGERCGVSRETETAVDRALGYGAQVAGGKTRTFHQIAGGSFTAALLLGMAVCAICNTAISGRLTWALYPISSIVLAWCVGFPVLWRGGNGLPVSMAALSVLLIPYLYVLDRLIGGQTSILPIAVPMALLALVFLWGVWGIFRRFPSRTWLAAAISCAFAVPMCLAADIVLSALLNQPMLQIWDLFGMAVLAALAAAFFRKDRKR